MNITLPPDQKLHPRRGSWARQFLAIFDRMPETSRGDVPQLGHLKGSRYSAVIDVGGKRVAIHTCERDDFIKPAAAEVDLVLTCHYWPSAGYPDNVRPFTMFAGGEGGMQDFHQKLPRYREMMRGISKRHRLGWSGRVWACRRPWLDELAAERWFFFLDCFSSERRRRGRKFIGPHFDQHVRNLASWQCALVLYGQGSRPGAGNRREHECLALGVPMVLNYQPVYHDPLVPGIHYLHFKNPYVLKWFVGSLPDATASRVAAEGLEYWKRSMSPEGMCGLLRRICRDYL